MEVIITGKKLVVKLILMFLVLHALIEIYIYHLKIANI